MSGESEGNSLPDVCVVTHPLSAAGENATRTLLEILSAVTTVSLITADLPSESTIRQRHEVVEISRKETGDSPPVAAVRFLLNQFKMCLQVARRPEEVILFFGATAYVLPMLVARALGRTVVVEPRGDVPLTLRLSWEQQLPASVAAVLAGGVRLLERVGFRLAHAIVTYTPGMARQLDLDVSSPRVFPTGARYVDAEQFAPIVPFEEREKVVGFLGRLDEEKGVRELATVARLLPDDVTFRFIGDGDLKEWLERELATEIEDGTVELIGWVDHDEVPAELNQLQLLVMPSRPTEGLPTTILEALACGTPVYATPVSGVPDIVRDGDTGFLIEKLEPGAITAEIKRILKRDALERIGDNGRALIESEYGFEPAVERYKSILAALSE